MEYQYLLKNLPVIFAVVGLALIIIGLFLKGRDKIYFNLSALLLFVFFVYKLYMRQNDPDFMQGAGGLSHSTPAYIFIFFTAIGLNILAFILWFFAILKVAFSKNIYKEPQTKALFLGALIFLVALLVYKILGILVGAVCFPIMAIGYFVAVKNYYWKIQAQ